jgi:hypothetical protein
MSTVTWGHRDRPWHRDRRDGPLTDGPRWPPPAAPRQLAGEPEPGRASVLDRDGRHGRGGAAAARLDPESGSARSGAAAARRLGIRGPPFEPVSSWSYH